MKKKQSDRRIEYIPKVYTGKSLRPLSGVKLKKTKRSKKNLLKRIGVSTAKGITRGLFSAGKFTAKTAYRQMKKGAKSRKKPSKNVRKNRPKRTYKKRTTEGSFWEGLF